jgi:hypothetical protein
MILVRRNLLLPRKGRAPVAPLKQKGRGSGEINGHRNNATFKNKRIELERRQRRKRTKRNLLLPRQVKQKGRGGGEINGHWNNATFKNKRIELERRQRSKCLQGRIHNEKDMNK